MNNETNRTAASLPISSLVSELPNPPKQDTANPNLPELTPDEIEAVLLSARKDKARRQTSRAYMERVNAKPVTPTAEQFDSWILSEAKREDENNPRYLGPNGFVLDDTNKRIFNMLSLYFTRDSRFLDFDASYAFDKGLALFGPVGCGKTTLMRLFTINPSESYTVTPCSVATHNYGNEGESYFDYYSGKSDVYGSLFQQTRGGRCFDDLGVEPIPVIYYGKKRNMMADVLERRYALSARTCGLTHLTTNLSWDQIEELYGMRIRSRMREMFNTIYFDPSTPDRRS